MALMVYRGLNKRIPILELLRKTYGSIDTSSFIATRVRNKGLFEFIVAVMLSQNTSDKNAIRAYENLKRVLGDITPEKILSTDLEIIKNAIKPAGMYNERAKRIYELAKIFLENNIEEEIRKYISEGKLGEARKTLLSLPGVGFKTADIVLLMYFGQPVFPVDTHIRRITMRLGYITRNDYEAISNWWMKQLKPEEYLEAHLLLIMHGRRICRAKNPKCYICPLRNYCKYYREKNK
jgi:endonuclease-3